MPHFRLLCLLCVLATGRCAAQDLSPESLGQVERLFSEVSKTDDPGCAIGIMRHGEVVVAEGFGAASVAFRRPNNPSTAFEIASGSKTFTCVCVAMLMDQKRLSPDDDIRKIIPELNLNQPVLIRHLLRCESGVWAQFHIMPLAGWDNVPVHSPYSKEDVFTVLCGQKELPFKPGSQFQYGSGDTFLLGMIVERVTGQTLAEFAKENLFDPLGMTRTWYLEDPAQVVLNRAVGHWKSKATWSSGPYSPASDWRQWNATAFLGGGGSVVTTVEDLMKWSRIFREDLLPQGKHVSEYTRDGTVLGNRFVLDVDAYMKHVNQHPENPPAGTYRGVKRIQVTGGYWGFTCCMSHFPELDLTIVCLSNSDSVSAVGTARRITDIVLKEQLEELPVADSPAVEFKDLGKSQLSRFLGSYRQKGNKPIARVSLNGSGLKLTTGYNSVADLRPVSDSTFRAIGDSPFYDSALFVFDLKDGDKVIGFSINSCEHGLHETVKHFRVEEAEPYTEKSIGEFTGTYISKELGAVYRFRADGNKLQMRVGSRRWEDLEPQERDEFSPVVEDPHNIRFIRFSREPDGNVDGFSIGFWRIHGVRFDRLSVSQ